jgi:hypothetical protein
MTTLPNKRDKFWQIVLFPTVSVYSSYAVEKHYSINVEWLFWTFTTIILTNDQ